MSVAHIGLSLEKQSDSNKVLVVVASVETTRSSYLMVDATQLWDQDNRADIGGLLCVAKTLTVNRVSSFERRRNVVTRTWNSRKRRALTSSATHTAQNI